MNNGMEESVVNNNNGKERIEEKGKGNSSKGVALRVLALGLTLAATIVLGVDKQTKLVSLKLIDSLPPITLPVTAKWHYLSAFTFFVVANGIASGYGAVSTLVVALGKRDRMRGLIGNLIIIGDALMVGLLFSANGATVAVGVIGFKGNSHVRWNKVCNVFDNFCHQVAAASVLSLLAAIAFLFLLILPIFSHRPNNITHY